MEKTKSLSDKFYQSLDYTFIEYELSQEDAIAGKLKEEARIKSIPGRNILTNYVNM